MIALPTGIQPVVLARRTLLALLLLWPDAWLLLVSPEPFSVGDAAIFTGLCVLGVALPFLWVRSLRAFWLWNLPVALVAGFYGAYVVYFRAAPYSGLWSALWATTWTELSELALHFRVAAFAGVALFAVYAVLAWTESTASLQLSGRARKLLAAIVAWAALCVLGIPTLWAFPDIVYRRPVTEEVFRSTYPAGFAVQAVRSGLRTFDDVAEAPRAVKFRATPGREIYVQVIGESEQYFLWRQQLDVSGAAFPRDPSVILFRENLSQANLTQLALPLILTGKAAPREALASPTWLQFAQARGCRTGWLAANEFPGQRMYRRSIDFVFDLHEVTRGVESHIYDDMMLPEIRRILAQGPEKVCLLVHMNGSHIAYGERYRPEQARYPVEYGKPGPDGLDPVKAAYQNSLLKSIAFVDGVIAALKSVPDARSFLLYAPDHGENMQDDARGLIAHSHNPPTLYEARIPLVVWSSPAFQREHAAQWQAMQANAQAGVPTSNQFLFPTMLWAMGVENPVADAPPTLFDDGRALRGFRRTVASSEDAIYGEDVVR